MNDPTPTATTESTATSSTSAPSTVNDAAAALAFADSSFATPETPETTPAAAVTPPVETPAQASTDPVVDDPRSPFIPRTRFDEVNTQKKAAEEALKQYDWAKELKPDEVQGLATWAKSLKTNPVEAALHLLTQLEADPQHAQALRSHAARMLGTRKQAEPAADPEPEPDLQAPDGTLVYSANRQREWREWNNKQLTSTLTKSFEDKLQPLQHVAQTFQAREKQAQAFTEVGTVLAQYRADPVFKAHEADIKAVLAADPELAALAERNPKLALKYAFQEVRLTKVVPQQLKDSEGKTLANLQQRAVAATTNPASASSATPRTTLGDARAALEYASTMTGGA